MNPARTEVGRRARTDLLHEWALILKAEAAEFRAQRDADVDEHGSNGATREAAPATQNRGVA